MLRRSEPSVRAPARQRSFATRQRWFVSVAARSLLACGLILVFYSSNWLSLCFLQREVILHYCDILCVRATGVVWEGLPALRTDRMLFTITAECSYYSGT